MNKRYRALIIIIAILLLAAGGIWYAKQDLRKSQPADAIPIKQKEQTPLDMRPAAIAKLQQLVKNGSDSLYKLRIDSLFTEISSGTIILKGVGLYADSTAMRRLQWTQKLPDDVFQIELASLRISGISLGDLLHRRDLHLSAIECSGPSIKVHHAPQPYNAGKRAAENSATLFSRMKGELDRLQIDSIRVRDGIVVDESNGTQNTIKEVSLLLRDILIDSASEHDETRFLFARKADLSGGSIRLPLGKSHYDLAIGGIDVSGGTQQIVLRDFSLHPQNGQEAFARRQKSRQAVYTIDAPQIILRGADWWAAVHGESIIAREAEATGARVRVFIDRHQPGSSGIKRDNFPQQMLQALGTPVSLKRVVVKDATLVYDEANEKSNEVGSISFNGLRLVADDVTNVPAEVAARPQMQVRGSCLFMNATPLQADFTFALQKAMRGAFTAALRMGAMGHEVVDRFAEAMGQVRFASGQLQSATVHLEGSNDNVHGNISAQYTDLHIETLKKKKGDDGHLKEKHVTSKIANVLLVKNSNPGKDGQLRQSDFSLDRTEEPNFFNFLWMGVKLGMLKTIGVPAKLGGM